MDTIRIVLSIHVLLSERCRSVAALVVTTSAASRRKRRRNSSTGAHRLQEYIGRKEQAHLAVDTHTYIRTHTYTNTNARTHTHTHTHTHTVCTYKWSNIIPKQVSEYMKKRTIPNAAR